MAAELVEHVMREGLEMVDRVDHHSFLLGDAGGEERQGGGEGERGEQLGLSLLLLQLLKEQDQLHSDTSKTTTVGSVETTIAGGRNDKNIVISNLKDKT